MLTNKEDVKSDDEEDQGRSHAPFVSQHLSCYSYFLILLLLISWILAFLLSVRFGVFYPLFFLPLIPFLLWWNKNTDTTELDLVLRLFLLGLAFAIPVWIIESVVITAGSALYSVGIDPECQPCLIFFLLPFLTMAMIVEEYTKYFLLLVARQWRPHFQHTRASLIYSISTALGFALSQSAFYSFLVILQLRQNQNDNYLAVFSIVGFLLFLFLPLHCLTGYLQGLGVVQRVLGAGPVVVPMTPIETSATPTPDDRGSISELPLPADGARDTDSVLQPCRGCCSVLFVPVLFRTLFFWQLSFWLILITRDHLWLVFALPVSIVCFLFVIGFIKRTESKLPLEYRQKVGYLIIPGFGIA